MKNFINMAECKIFYIAIGEMDRMGNSGMEIIDYVTNETLCNPYKDEKLFYQSIKLLIRQ